MFSINPKLISEITGRSGKDITGESSLYSSSFPINIVGLISNRVGTIF
ncbi:unknown [Clostridium sp. CAG:417]|nr:unknown [Clostridium sp. CAG:417]